MKYKCPKCELVLKQGRMRTGDKRPTKIWVCVPCKRFYKIDISKAIEEIITHIEN